MNANETRNIPTRKPTFFEKRHIRKRIRNAARDGHTNVNIYEHINTVTIRWLRDLGYKVERREYPYVNVSWKED